MIQLLPYAADPRFDRHCAGREQHRIDRRQIINASPKNQKFGKKKTIGPSQKAIRAPLAAAQKKPQAGNANRRAQGMHQKSLLRDEFNQVTCTFFMRSTFRRISIVGQWFLASQSKFGKKIKNEMQRAKPDPRCPQQCALAGHEQRQKERQPEKQRRVLIQNPDSGHKPEQKP